MHSSRIKIDSLDDYVPRNEMFAAFKLGFNETSLSAIGSDFQNYLITRQLTKLNYCSVLEILLNMEDLETLRPYAKLYQRNRQVQNFPTGNYHISINTELNPETILKPFIDDLVFLKKSVPVDCSDILRCSAKRNIHSSAIFAKVKKVRRDRIDFKFDIENRSDISSLNFKKYLIKMGFFKEPFNVIFRPTRIPFRLMYKSLKCIDSTLLDYLFPTENISRRHEPRITNGIEINFLNKSIAKNLEQRTAVYEILFRLSTQAPFIVFGPPGTGKTTTIVEAILQLYLQGSKRILVAAGSNSACDTVALRICEYFESHELLKEYCKESKQNLMRLYAHSYQLGDIPSKLKEHFMCTKSHSCVGYQIIITTLCTVARIQNSSFTHIFIDEAAASTEPEALMGIVGVKSSTCYVILSGDHKQLGAVIKNNRATELGLGQSLMERLLLSKLYEVDASGNYDDTLQVHLRRNYRSHPAIVGIYNKLYYNNKLIPLAPPAEVNKAANWSKLTNGQFPVLFQAIAGTTVREINSTSSFNSMEAKMVCSYVQNLLEKISTGGLGLKEEDIGIITPYLGQCKLLTKMLHEINLCNVEVGSVESYQGREKPVIIVSLVASNTNTIFLSNSRRINVFLSRPKWLLILIGNPTTLKKNEEFRYIIDQCQLQRNYFDKDDVVSISHAMSKLTMN